MVAFLDALRSTPIVTSAVEAAMKASRYTATIGGMRKMVYRWRDLDPAFRSKWDAALESGWDRAEQAAFQRGVEGVEEPIISHKTGTVLGHKTVYSDKLLEVVLKGNRAKVYGDKTKVEVEHGISPGLADLVCELRMRRQRLSQSENVRNLSAGEAKVLELNTSTEDVVSSGDEKQAQEREDKR